MTTLEGLLCEVSPLMESSLAIRSGEQLFYGESLLLVPHSNEGPSTSGRHSRHSESRRHSESHSKKGKKGHSKSQPRQDGLHNAIANAKETLRKALEDGSPAVAVPQNVMNEITALKSENVAIRKEMGELRKLFLDLQTNLKPPPNNTSNTSYCWYQSLGRRVLILGDGNLSFSVALASARPEVQLTATVFEDEHSFESRYPSSVHMLACLRSLAPRVKLLFGVDARYLPLDWLDRFDDIIWNFPHPGGKTNLRKSRELMRAVFAGVSCVIGAGRFHVTLARRQSGLDHKAVVERRFVKVGSVPVHSSDSWQTAYLAAESNLVISDAREFHPDMFPAYTSSGYRSRDQMFHNKRDSETLTLKCTPAILELEQMKKYEMEQHATQPARCFHELRPFFVHDISILYEEPAAIPNWESALLVLIKETCGTLVRDVSEVKQLRALAPNDLPNRIYRLTWQAWRKALSKALCNSLQEQLRSAIISASKRGDLKILLT